MSLNVKGHSGSIEPAGFNVWTRKRKDGRAGFIKPVNCNFSAFNATYNHLEPCPIVYSVAVWAHSRFLGYSVDFFGYTVGF